MSGIKNNNTKFNLKIAFIADDIFNLTEFGINHNATFALMLEAQSLKKNKNIKILFCESSELKLKNGKVFAKFNEVEVKREFKNHIKILSTEEYSLDSIDIVFARRDPPIDENYISHMKTLLLASENTFIINDPKGILISNEKLCTFNFPNLIPRTLVTTSREEVVDFLNAEGEIILKPLFNKGGTDIFHVKKTDKDINSILDVNMSGDRRVIAQQYLPEAIDGDKRIILLNGEVLGGIRRIPKKGEFRAHISRGASYEKLNLSDRDMEICNVIKPYLIKNGLYFVGIDVIGNYLIEINLTCPSNIVEVGECNSKNIPLEIIEWVVLKKRLG